MKTENMNISSKRCTELVYICIGLGLIILGCLMTIIEAQSEGDTGDYDYKDYTVEDNETGAQTEGDIAYDYQDAYDDEYGDDEVLGVEPVFDVPLVNVTVVAGQTALLPCSIKHLGKYKVAWTDQKAMTLTYEDRRVVDDSRFSIVRSYQPEWNLQIRDVSWTDQGAYHCTINTQTPRSKQVILHIKVPPRIIDELSSHDETVQEGDTVVLICNVTGVPKPTVTWYRTPVRGTGATKESKMCDARTYGPGIGLTGEMIIISNVSRYCDDTYECQASNGVSPDVSRQMRVTVEFPPEVKIRTSVIRQAKGKETILECKITAYPQAVNYWTKDGNRVMSSIKHHIEAFDDEETSTISLNLHLVDITEDDFGEYTCIAGNAHGTDRGTMFLKEIVAEERGKHKDTTIPTLSFVIPFKKQKSTHKPVGKTIYITDKPRVDRAGFPQTGDLTGGANCQCKIPMKHLLCLAFLWLYCALKVHTT